jgi:hypothetical protein
MTNFSDIYLEQILNDNIYHSTPDNKKSKIKKHYLINKFTFTSHNIENNIDYLINKSNKRIFNHTKLGYNDYDEVSNYFETYYNNLDTELRKKCNNISNFNDIYPKFIEKMIIEEKNANKKILEEDKKLDNISFMTKYKSKDFFKEKYLQNILIKEIFTLYPQESIRIPNKYFIFLITKPELKIVIFTNKSMYEYYKSVAFDLIIQHRSDEVYDIYKNTILNFIKNCDKINCKTTQFMEINLKKKRIYYGKDMSFFKNENIIFPKDIYNNITNNLSISNSNIDSVYDLYYDLYNSSNVILFYSSKRLLNCSINKLRKFALCSDKILNIYNSILTKNKDIFNYHNYDINDFYINKDFIKYNKVNYKKIYDIQYNKYGDNINRYNYNKIYYNKELRKCLSKDFTDDIIPLNYCELQLLYKQISNKNKLFNMGKVYEINPYFYDLKNNIIKFLFCDIDNHIMLLELNNKNIIKNNNNKTSCSSSIGQFTSCLLEMQEKMRNILFKDKSGKIFDDFDSIYKYFDNLKSKIIKLENKTEECYICYENKEEVFITECKHNFCVECSRKWFKNNNSCPYCKSKVDKEILFKEINNNSDLDGINYCF